MKKLLKTLLIVCAILLTASGAWWLYLVYGPRPAVQDVLPSGAMAFVQLSKPAEHWQKATQSELWKNIASIDLPKVLARNKVPSATITQVERWQKQTTAFFNSPLTKK